ncbi:PhoX family protein [bacterium]|nr:PhoX family protein [bacterium]
MKSTRRHFFQSAGMTTAGFLGLQKYLQLDVKAQEKPQAPKVSQPYQSQETKYGDLVADPRRILDLPEGFSYTVLSVTGDTMSDGLKTPGAPDGMAAFAAEDGKVILVRNHELSDHQTFEGPYGIVNEKLSELDLKKLYDPGHGKRPQLGGTSNLVFDPKLQRLEKQFLSLAGTERNCAGGLTPWGTWITCEETVSKSGDNREVHHGYNFEVPATSNMGLVDPVPLKDMGRFNHEAIAVDPTSGIVYQTEDRDDGLITRFIPNEPENLQAGGKLQAMVIKDKKSCDTRNWPDKGEPRFPIEESIDVEWMDLEDTENLDDKMRQNGHKAGAAIFARGEGMWYGNNRIYFACTSGGIAKSGQIFIYQPSPYEGTMKESKTPGKVMLYLEPNNTRLLEYGDNLTVAPWGDIVLCEDGAKEQYLRGITPTGKIYTLARSSYAGNSELCGVCFAPNHPTLFVNIQRPGITLAITGPWKSLNE